ncbi:MAG: phosphotransferase [Sedimentisphaerales bacterium]|nr:phosphotransferase [Sedimentisphaerales bacterium]
MQKGARISSEELAEVLSHYDIGKIRKVMRLVGGSRRAPKIVVTTTKGRFLLKRRLQGRDDVYRVAFSHAVQIHLAKRYFPIAPLVKTRDEASTLLQSRDSIYELFKFVGGVRYTGSAEQTIDTGRQLARFHQYLENFKFEWEPLKASFHDSTTVRGHLKTVASDSSGNSERQIHDAGEELMALYNAAGVRVNELGFDKWREQVVHGDWHPGNMLFDKGKLVAVLDFDSVKIAPPITDLANSMLQFSIVGYQPNPVDWPDYLDQAKLVQVLEGYREVIKLERNKVDSLLDLMIETMIAEAVLPIAATGFFGNLKGLDFLKMILRKARWIDTNRKILTSAIES